MTNKYQVDVPEGQIGDWWIEKHTVTKEEAALGAMRAAFGSGRCVPEGTYTGLKRKGGFGGSTLVMSDSPDEIRDHWEPIHKATGHCLVNGLGLGVVLNAMLMKDEVEHVTVIELSTDVIQLVEPHWREKWGDRFTVINADAFEHKPPKGERYNVVWHDIWDTICADNLPDMHKLHRKYGRRADWQGSWCRCLCERQNRTNW